MDAKENCDTQNHLSSSKKPEEVFQIPTSNLRVNSNTFNGNSNGIVDSNSLLDKTSQRLAKLQQMDAHASKIMRENQKSNKKKDVYSIFLSDLLIIQEKSANIKSTNLIKAYVRAIFRFGLDFLSKDDYVDENYLLLKELYDTQYESILTIASLEWIWTPSYEDSDHLCSQKKLFRSVSEIFLKDDLIVHGWIEKSQMKESNKKAYLEKKSIFESGLQNPSLLKNLTFH